MASLIRAGVPGAPDDLQAVLEGGLPDFGEMDGDGGDIDDDDNQDGLGDPLADTPVRQQVSAALASIQSSGVPLRQVLGPHLSEYAQGILAKQGM